MDMYDEHTDEDKSHSIQIGKTGSTSGTPFDGTDNDEYNLDPWAFDSATETEDSVNLDPSVQKVVFPSKLELQNSVWTVTMILVSMLCIGIMLIYLRFILVPLVLALALCYLMRPMINYLTGKKPLCGKRACIPNGIAILIAIFVVICILIAIGVVIFFSVREVTRDWNDYEDRFNELLERGMVWADNKGLDRERIEDAIRGFDSGAFALNAASSIFLILPGFFTVVLMTLYMLKDYRNDSEKSAFQNQVDSRIRKYIFIKVIISAITGILVGVTLVFLRVDMAVMFGMLTFLLNFIPTLGSFVAVILPIPLVLLDPDKSWITIMLVIVLPTIIQIVIGSFIEPMIAGKAMEMSALAVLISLSFWVSVWGIPGGIISVPLTVVIKLLLESTRVPECIVIAKIISGDFNFSAVSRRSRAMRDIKHPKANATHSVSRAGKAMFSTEIKEK